MPKISFNNKKSPFFSVLREKVNQYFANNKIDTAGNRKLYIKGLIQISSAILLYVTLVFFTPGNFLAILLCGLLGINFALIGFNVMHEGGHQSLSKYKSINTMGAYALNILGGNTYFWKIKHNVNHHTYTNIAGMDDDMEVKPFMRLSDTQPRYWFHKFQHLYCLVLYGISYFAWVFWDDFAKYFTGKVASGNQKKFAPKEHLIFWVSKLSYIGIYIVFPVFMVGLVKVLIGFAIVTFVCGFSIAIVFQLAHIVKDTHFPLPNKLSNKIEEEWAIHQINTTANFSTKSKVVSWLMGGLNFQVEHHLFPKVSHVHYPKINQFVKETCEQFNIKYIEYPTVFKAIASHLSHVKRLGRAG